MRFYDDDYEEEIQTSINIYADSAEELQDTAEEIEYALLDFRATAEPEDFHEPGEEYTIYITGHTMYSANEYGEAENEMNRIAERWAN